MQIPHNIPKGYWEYPILQNSAFHPSLDRISSMLTGTRGRAATCAKCRTALPANGHSVDPTPTLQTGKLRLRDVRILAEGHVTHKARAGI